MTSNSNKPKIKRNKFGVHIPYKWEKEAFLRDLDADPTLTAGTKAITRVIAHNFDEEKNHSVASVSYIAKASGMSRRSVIYNVPHVLTSYRAARLRKGIGTASSLWAVHWWCRGSSFIREKLGDAVHDIRTDPISSGAIGDTSGGDTDCTTTGASGAISAPNNIITPLHGVNNSITASAHGLSASASRAAEVLKIVYAEVLAAGGDTILKLHIENEDGELDNLQIVVESNDVQKQSEGQRQLNKLADACGIERLEDSSDLINRTFLFTFDGDFLPVPANDNNHHHT